MQSWNEIYIFPHQLNWMPLFFGSVNVKNITIMEIAVPASRAIARIYIVVFLLPFKVKVMNDIVENEAAKYGRTVVDPWNLRQIYKYAKESWDVDVSPDGKREATSQEVERDGCKEPNGEEPEESRISVGTKVSWWKLARLEI